MSADNGQLSSGRISSAFAREPALEILPEQRGALQRARDYVATVSEKTVFSWGVVVVLVAIVWTYAGGQSDLRALSSTVTEMRADLRDIRDRMMTREQVEDVVARRLAEARKPG